MSATSIADSIYAFRFLRLLTKKWEDMPAYDLGIIDDEGTPLKKVSELRSSEEKAAYTLFHRLVFKIRRIIQKLPFGKSIVASYAAALYLLKEKAEYDNVDLEVINEWMTENGYGTTLTESSQEPLAPGVYRVVAEEIIIPSTCESISAKGHEVILDVASEPVDNILGENIYQVTHKPTGQKIFVSQKDIAK